MTKAEAELVAKLIGFADGACSNCVRTLVEQANRLFPEFIWTFPSDDTLAHDYYNLDWHMLGDEPWCESYIPVTVEPRP